MQMARSIRQAFIGLALIGGMGWGGSLQAADLAEVTVRLTIPKLVNLTQLNDVHFGEWSGSGGLAADQQPCIWSTTRSYSLSATSSESASGGFALTTTDGERLAYHVFWNDGSGFRELAAGQPVNGMPSSARSTTCSGGGDMAARPVLRVVIDEQRLAAAPRGEYLGQLRLLVTAE